ncbi:MAG TPA: M56 family metallopeptidase [Sphingomicrobium sp.]|nr:M56 family metallopeptidase [Sphingomicrobium sp.]
MYVLIGIALKSLLIAGVTLGLLELMKSRSAAERSWVAHIGLVALLLLAVAPLVLPSWNLEAPALLGRDAAPAAATSTVAPAEAAAALPSIAPTAEKIVATTATEPQVLSPLAAAMMLYALPAAILLLVTALALARLITLRARADVLVDGHWLSALARAQRRMGFKHGTALLTSDELASPISWGLMRPVILLNSQAVEASGEAEAIIAHELAHVARMDWVKLLLARLATALFWFNPLVWILAREAHQLREEAADDAVLAADIADTDYAQLLVGVARHECPGLLLGAHGVAPSKNSLSRRIARVLDVRSVRGPVARSFALGMLACAVLVAAPLAALTVTPGGTEDGKVVKAEPRLGARDYLAEVPTDLPSIIAGGVSTAVSAVAPEKVEPAQQARAAAIAEAVESAEKAREVAIAQAGAATARARSAVRAHALSDDEVDVIIQMKAVGVTRDYANAIRAVSPTLGSLDATELAGLKAVGVTPEFVRSLAAAGFRHLDANQVMTARAVGMTGDYARAMAAAGVARDFDDYVQLRAVGVPVQYVIKVRRSGQKVRDADRIVEMWAVGVDANDLKRPPPAVPAPPVPPANWDPTDGDADDG